MLAFGDAARLVEMIIVGPTTLRSALGELLQHWDYGAANDCVDGANLCWSLSRLAKASRDWPHSPGHAGRLL